MSSFSSTLAAQSGSRARKDNMKFQPDGSFFIDADPEVFRYIIEPCRRPTVFPFLWTKENGFDHAMYNRIRAEADYWQLHRLEEWIRTKEYLKAVKTEIETEIRPAWGWDWKDTAVERFFCWKDTVHSPWTEPDIIENRQRPLEQRKTDEAHLDRTLELLNAKVVTSVKDTSTWRCPIDDERHTSMADCLRDADDPCGEGLQNAAFNDIKIDVGRDIPQSVMLTWKVTTIDSSVCYADPRDE